MTTVKNNFHSKSIREIIKIMHTSETEGLSEKEAEIRLKKFGPNLLPERKPPSGLTIFFNQLKNPLVYLLLAAAAIALFFHDQIDAFFILTAILIIVLLGFFQEYKAQKSLSSLLLVIKKYAYVTREGRKKKIKAENLVPGDLIFVKEGDKIPADARLVKVKNLETIEAPLTGESLSVHKKTAPLPLGTIISDQNNMVFADTIVARGFGSAIVCATGQNTEIGKIAQTLEELEEQETPLQKHTAHLARWIAMLVIIFTILIVFLGLLAGHPFLQVTLTAVAVAVAAIPESLVVAVTFILALGMNKLSKNNALVRHLTAAEALGSVTFICVDKTGTITEGKMHMAEIATFGTEISKIETLKCAMLCNEAWVENPSDPPSDWKTMGDVQDQAFLHAAFEVNLQKEYQEAQKKLLDVFPFESKNKFSAALYKNEKVNLLYVKGAPEVVFKESTKYLKEKKELNLLEQNKEKLERTLQRFNKEGLRVLAFAYKKASPKLNQIPTAPKEVLKNLTFLGLIALTDPIRENVKETIRKAQKAGIRVAMITGDHKITARYIAQQIGLPSQEENIIEGEELNKIPDRELQKKIEKISVFARILPHDKLRIVEALQKKKEIVAMTGDGVNDAPALKKADVGVVLGSGQDISKEIADLVLLDDNFQTLVYAIEGGRVIFSNIRKVITFLLFDCFTEIILIATSILFGLPLPLLPAQILWVNIVEDTFPSFALAVEPKEKGIMKEKADKHRVLVNKEMKMIIFFLGIVTDLLLFTLFLYLYKKNFNLAHIRTMIFAALTIDSLFAILSLRSLHIPLWKINPFSNLYVWFFIFFGILMLILAIYFPIFQVILKTVPLTFSDWLIILLLCIVDLVGLEIIKTLTRIKNLALWLK